MSGADEISCTLIALAIFIMVLSYVADEQVAFGLAGLVGILAHEIVVLLVPAMLFSRRWRRALWSCAVCALGFLLTRFWMGAGYGGSLRKEALFYSYHLAHPAEWLKEVVLTWYLLWLLFGMGIVMLPAKKMPLLVCTGLLGGGAFVLSLFVLDTERTYSILAPVVAVGAAVVFDRLWREHRIRRCACSRFHSLRLRQSRRIGLARVILSCCLCALFRRSSAWDTSVSICGRGGVKRNRCRARDFETCNFSGRDNEYRMLTGGAGLLGTT